MWRQFIRGNARFKVQDAGVALINKLRKFCPRDIEICVNSGEETLEFSVDLSFKREISRLLYKRDFTVVENNNIFKTLNFVYSRTAVIFTALICILSFIALDRLVFRVNIDGLDGAEHTQVASYLQENGVRRFRLKSRDLSAVTHSLVSNFDFIAAANIYITGATLRVNVLRADNISAELEYAADITSPVDGVIERILVLGGTQVAQAGQVVRTGDILVQGPRASAIIHIHNGTEVVAIINETIVI